MLCRFFLDPVFTRVFSGRPLARLLPPRAVTAVILIEAIRGPTITFPDAGATALTPRIAQINVTATIKVTDLLLPFRIGVFVHLSALVPGYNVYPNPVVFESRFSRENATFQSNRGRSQRGGVRRGQAMGPWVSDREGRRSKLLFLRVLFDYFPGWGLLTYPIFVKLCTMTNMLVVSN